MSRLGKHRERLAADMERRGDWPGQSPWVRAAIEAIPRDLFAPDRLWRWDGHRWAPVDRAVDPEAWADELYRSQDDAAVTQIIDDHPASSLSCQGVVASMAACLRLEPGHRVGEAGTGTGWNAALLARRAGPGRVTSIEVDPALAEQARSRLAAAGAEVTVVVGDAADGWPDAAPFDRFIATYAVDRVPWPWVQQTAPGGLIVLPWGRLGLTALTVAPDRRSACGPIVGLAQFMPARDQLLTTAKTWRELWDTVEPGEVDTTARDPEPLRINANLLFHLRVTLADIKFTTAVDEDGTSAWLHDGATSWASLIADGGEVFVNQGGPRRLADEVLVQWDQWTRLGEPDVDDYGITVCPDEQYAWCRDPQDGPRWPQP